MVCASMQDVENKIDSTEPTTRRKERNWPKVGVGLIFLSGLLWAPLPVIPFLPLSTTAKVALAGVLFTSVQIAWWSGSALAGPAVVRKIRGWLRLKSKPVPDTEAQATGE